MFLIYLPLSLIATSLLITIHNVDSSGNIPLVLFQHFLFTIVSLIVSESLYLVFIEKNISNEHQWHKQTSKILLGLITLIISFHYIDKFLSFPTHTQHLCFFSMLIMVFRTKYNPWVSVNYSLSFFSLLWILL